MTHWLPVCCLAARLQGAGAGRQGAACCSSSSFTLSPWCCGAAPAAWLLSLPRAEVQITVSVPIVGSPNSGSSLHWVGTTAQCWCTLPSRRMCHALALRRRTVHTAAMHRSRLPPAAAGPRAPACPKPSCPLLSPPQPAPFHAARSTLTRAAPSRCWTSSPTALSSPTPSPGPASECAPFCWSCYNAVRRALAVAAQQSLVPASEWMSAGCCCRLPMGGLLTLSCARSGGGVAVRCGCSSVASSSNMFAATC